MTIWRNPLRCLVLFTAAILAAIWGPAAYACSAAIGKVGTIPVVDYDPFRPASAKSTLRILIELDDPANCALALSISGASPGAGRTMKLGSNHLIYRLYSRDREVVDDPNAFMPLDIDESHQGVEVTIDMPAGQIGPAGIYFDPLVLRLVDLNAGQAQLGPEMSAVVTAAVDSRAQVNIAGSSSDLGARFAFATLDLGVLRQGVAKDAFLQVRSTAPVTIRLSSRNGGALAREGPQSLTLPYEFEFENVAVPLSGQGSLLSRPASISLAGTAYHLVARVVSDPDRLPAGDYHDLITIEVAAN